MDEIVIGLVNNMPDAAIRTTELQFKGLLSATSFSRHIIVRKFYLPEIPRSDLALLHLRRHYEPVDQLWSSHLDGLFVTGTQPRARVLTHEPYWTSLRKVVDWAEGHAVSTVWSCLAAHAAVLHMDGVDRKPLGGKLSGVFTCRKVAEHPILEGMPSEWPVPHSRYNGLPHALLDATGYRILSASDDAGVDLFIKYCGGLFIFLQGHPEYDAAALSREHRRDVIQFLSGRSDTFPEAPRNYFDSDTALALAKFRQRAIQYRSMDLLAEVPTCQAWDSLRTSWHEAGTRIFANWLAYLMAERSSAASVMASAPGTAPRRRGEWIAT